MVLFAGIVILAACTTCFWVGWLLGAAYRRDDCVSRDTGGAEDVRDPYAVYRNKYGLLEPQTPGVEGAVKHERT